MVVPDIELVSEMMLAAEGFIYACLLARKFITFYPLCRELLPEQVRVLWVSGFNTHPLAHTVPVQLNIAQEEGFMQILLSCILKRL